MWVTTRSYNTGNVNKIGEYAFYECKSLQEVTIPQNIYKIGEYAFSSCSELKKVTISKGVGIIGDCAFFNCYALEEIKIPESVTTISRQVFSYDSSLKKIDVDDNNKNYCSKDGVLYSKDKKELIKVPALVEDAYIAGVTDLIDFNAFEDCKSLKTLAIPDSIKQIKMCYFEKCKALEKIMI